jgi:hypothetical protein
MRTTSPKNGEHRVEGGDVLQRSSTREIVSMYSDNRSIQVDEKALTDIKPAQKSVRRISSL